MNIKILFIYFVCLFFISGEYGGWQEAIDAGDYRAVFVFAEPLKIPRHNFYEFVWLLKTGLPRYVSDYFLFPLKIISCLFKAKFS